MRLSPASIKELRRRYEAEEPLAILAKEYGIDYNHAYKLVTYEPSNVAIEAAERRHRQERDDKASLEHYGFISEAWPTPAEWEEIAGPEPPELAQVAEPSFADRVESLAGEGLTPKQIAVQLDSPYHTVYQALRRRHQVGSTKPESIQPQPSPVPTPEAPADA